MSHWPVQEAKARFSELLDTCVKDGPQVVTRRGTETAVLVPMAEWRRIQQARRPTLKELLLEPSTVDGFPTPDRRSWKGRAAPDLD